MNFLISTSYHVGATFYWTRIIADGAMVTTNKDTNGTAKLGDNVRVYYSMIAPEIEAKPATPTKSK